MIAKSGSYDILKGDLDLPSGTWTVFVADHTGADNCNTITIATNASYPIPDGFTWW